ncbi:GGDEF domain-containing phosphodiesterase [Pigmentiphaga sp.]|uniref:GGDEF domain-containing phosphodiesterase n=1 Tax=Pigmentiphaga sp. TaxID=1977564 RepID=UPI0025DCBFB9|nr:GGDEF domain-containing phosphodiesterase [Pigmentiphaga sp.]MBX6318910.1 EAL domain-containing protein [Pigmentiphaga sp.]
MSMPPTPRGLKPADTSRELATVGKRATLLRELDALIADRRRAAVLALALPSNAAPPVRNEILGRIRHFIRQDDLLCVLDATSLVIVLRDVNDRSGAIGAAQRLFQRSSLLQILGASRGGAMAAFGIVMLPSDLPQSSSVLLRAQQAARYALRTRARWVCWSDAPDDFDGKLVSREDSLVTEVMQGLDRGEFELFYQPQLETGTGRLRGMEALLRWNRRGELVMPNDFVPEVEAAGLSTVLGAWVLRRACEQLARWQEEGVFCSQVAVNLSAEQLRSDLPDVVSAVLREYDVEPGRLEIELTESGEIADHDAAIDITRRIHEMGVRFSLDDFGSGYSNFLRLRVAPFTAVKLDRQFVAGMLHNVYDKEMLRTVIQFCQSVDIRTIAEGVETAQQLEALKALGCDAWQGFLCSPPMASDEAADFLRRF